MEYFFLGMVFIWLGLVSWFDLRQREVPHTAWVVIPLICAAIYQAVAGDWPLSFLSGMVALASERQRLAKLSELRVDTIFFWIPWLLACLYAAATRNPVGALAIVVFWAAWELRCWGGADAVTAITLTLIWPDMRMVIAVLIVHAFVAAIASLDSLIRERKLRVHQFPGLPLLLMSAVLRLLSIG
jgi:hypothetical protein